jgi:hypothetical protein
MIESNYDKYPVVEVPNGEGRCVVGRDAVVKTLCDAIAARGAVRTVLTLECYAGVLEADVFEVLQALNPSRIIRSADAFLPEEEVDAKVTPFNGGEDPIFGWMTNLQMADFMDQQKMDRLAAEIEQVQKGLVVVLGPGASLIHPGDLLVYADMARWEAQLRMRRDEISNLGVENKDLKWSLQYKRAYFTDWRVCDKLKRDLMGRWDFVLDTNKKG